MTLNLPFCLNYTHALTRVWFIPSYHIHIQGIFSTANGAHTIAPHRDPNPTQSHTHWIPIKNIASAHPAHQVHQRIKCIKRIKRIKVIKGIKGIKRIKHIKHIKRINRIKGIKRTSGYQCVPSGTIRDNQVQSGTIRYNQVPVGTSVPGTSIPGEPIRPRPNQRC